MMSSGDALLEADREHLVAMPDLKIDRTSRAVTLGQALTLAGVLMLLGCGGRSSSPSADTQGKTSVQHASVVRARQQRRATHREHARTRSRPGARASQPHPHHRPGVQQPRQSHNQQRAHHPAHATHPAHQPAPSIDASATFKKGYQVAIASLTQSSQAIGTALRDAPSQRGAQILRTFRGLSARWKSDLSRLETLTPPASVTGNFSALTGAGKRIEADLDAIVAAIAGHDAAAGKQAVVSIVADLVAARSANATLERKVATA